MFLQFCKDFHVLQFYCSQPSSPRNRKCLECRKCPWFRPGPPLVRLPALSRPLSLRRSTRRWSSSWSTTSAIIEWTWGQRFFTFYTHLKQLNSVGSFLDNRETMVLKCTVIGLAQKLSGCNLGLIDCFFSSQDTFFFGGGGNCSRQESV
jgi:hypothetical protein